MQQKATHVVPRTFQSRTTSLRQIVLLVPTVFKSILSTARKRAPLILLSSRSTSTGSIDCELRRKTSFAKMYVGMLILDSILLLVTCHRCFTSFDGCPDVPVHGSNSRFPDYRDGSIGLHHHRKHKHHRCDDHQSIENSHVCLQISHVGLENFHVGLELAKHFFCLTDNSFL